VWNGQSVLRPDDRVYGAGLRGWAGCRAGFAAPKAAHGHADKLIPAAGGAQFLANVVF
jgi:hypothetical protein